MHVHSDLGQNHQDTQQIQSADLHQIHPANAPYFQPQLGVKTPYIPPRQPWYVLIVSCDTEKEIASYNQAGSKGQFK
jgi:hypothetical protein